MFSCCWLFIVYRSTSNKRPRYLFEHDLKTPAFNRKPAFIGDPASIRTLALRPLHLLISVVSISPVYVNFTLRILILSVYIYLVS